MRNGRGHQLSTDHTLGAELMRQGAITAPTRRWTSNRPWLGVDLLARLAERLSGDLDPVGSGTRAPRDLV